jgi:hypothetical protein
MFLPEAGAAEGLSAHGAHPGWRSHLPRSLNPPTTEEVATVAGCVRVAVAVTTRATIATVAVTSRATAVVTGGSAAIATVIVTVASGANVITAGASGANVMTAGASGTNVAVSHRATVAITNVSYAVMTLIVVIKNRVPRCHPLIVARAVQHLNDRQMTHPFRCSLCNTGEVRRNQECRAKKYNQANKAYSRAIHGKLLLQISKPADQSVSHRVANISQNPATSFTNRETPPALCIIITCPLLNRVE